MQGLSAGGVDQLNAGDCGIEHVPDSAAADRAALCPEAELEQQRGGRQPHPFSRVLGRNEGHPAGRLAQAAGDSGQHVCELRAGHQKSFGISFDGAICSSGTSSPVVGSRYCTRLWWVISKSSSMRTPVSRRVSMIAQVQKAWSSSSVRSRRLPVPGPSAQIFSVLIEFVGRHPALPVAEAHAPFALGTDAAGHRAGQSSRAASLPPGSIPKANMWASGRIPASRPVRS